jgi:hypothetical protein
MTADPPAAEVKCLRCGAVLGHREGDLIRVGTAAVPPPGKLICWSCGFVRNYFAGAKRVDTAGPGGQTNG